MTNAIPNTALRDAGLALDIGSDAADRRSDAVRDASSALRLLLHRDLDSAAAQWRRFEQTADCTPFQTFDWLAAWQRHIGRREGARPVVAVASFADGTTAFILPLAVEPRLWARRLCWLGQDLNDYNAPLLAPDFSRRVSPDRFIATWRELRALIRAEPSLRHDWIELEKMPETIGGQANPFFSLAVADNPSGAHFTTLGSDWDTFYVSRRSSATRRRDRIKRKHMSELGEVGFVTCADADDARRTLETLMVQKRRLFARRGIADMFARPGWREFFLDMAADAQPPCRPGSTPHDSPSTAPELSPPHHAAPDRMMKVHVSRVQVGAACAAANFGIEFGDTYYHVLASYDDGELSRFGPGALHLRELMAHAVGRGLGRFDFTIGDEPYKREWADFHSKVCDYATIAGWRGWPAWCWSALRRPVKRFVKQTPWAWRAASRTRELVGSRWRRRALAPAAGVAAAAAPLRSSRPPVACVIGDAVLLRPLAAAGIRCAIAAPPGTRALRSRFAQSRLLLDHAAEDAAEAIEQLIRFGRAEREPPVLFYQADSALRLVSRARERLAPAFRFVIPEPSLVEDLLDETRFRALAELHGLPVPPAREPAASSRTPTETYHCYIDRQGKIAGEFTGRESCGSGPLGRTTTLEIAEDAEIARQGRLIAQRLGLCGVASFAFRRDAAGTLRLLRIKPRFSSWHCGGAAAGVNIPALVFADLTGIPRPQPVAARAGIRWSRRGSPSR